MIRKPQLGLDSSNNMTSHSASPLTLPVVTIQNTFQEVIQEVLDGIIPSDKFWVSCYKSFETSVHAKVHAELDELDRNLVNLSPVEGDVEMVKTSNGVSVSYVTFPHRCFQAYSIFLSIGFML